MNTKLRVNLLLLSVFTGTLLFGQKQDIALADIYSTRTFGARTVQGLQSMNDGLHYTAIKKNALVKYSYKTGEAIDTLVKTSDFENENIKHLSNYQFSENEQRILFYVNPDYIYRRSFIADYYVWDFSKKQLYPVSEDGKEQLATFSPS
ncbi:MAG: DPP IV N-terminal domain-containing protein [Salinivirgaceae bacterium]|nr:DPP IV N-terminal domain-containing protein [Salinivirgaceae bacterium]